MAGDPSAGKPGVRCDVSSPGTTRFPSPRGFQRPAQAAGRETRSRRARREAPRGFWVSVLLGYVPVRRPATARLRFSWRGGRAIAVGVATMKALVPVLILGLVLLALVLGARCSQRAMHDYEMRGVAQTEGSPAGAPANPNSAPNDLAERELMAERFPDTLLSTTGIRFRILREGAGPKPIAGSRVRAHYTGRLLDGTVFDSSENGGPPYAFTLMKGEVIRGWDDTLIDMRKGERRLVVLPSRLAYGERGSPPVIPRRAPLVFEIELVDFR